MDTINILRQIKFRVYDKITKQFIYFNEPTFVNYDVDGKNVGFELSFDGVGKENNAKRWSRSQEEYILQQFTGLKDKKGVEMYEGDIVKYKVWQGNMESENDAYESKGVIEFKNGAFTPRPYYDECEDSWYSYKTFDFEVIGNIFENPDLVK